MHHQDFLFKKEISLDNIFYRQRLSKSSNLMDMKML